MRYIAPSREQLDASVFTSLPLQEWQDYASLLHGEHWPSITQLNKLWPVQVSQRFIAQNRALLEDGLHYEQRIAERGFIATRENNWHDLFNALIWLRYGAIKRALNTQQMLELAKTAPNIRTRVQYALTHFDEAGVIVGLRDPTLLACWDSHDWYGLFWQHRHAWQDGRIEWIVFGHALLEHALTPDKLLVSKALVFVLAQEQTRETLLDECARYIAQAQVLRDPLELRPLPLSGIPGWHAANEAPDFYHSGACFRPLRAGRHYPIPWVLTS